MAWASMNCERPGSGSNRASETALSRPLVSVALTCRTPYWYWIASPVADVRIDGAGVGDAERWRRLAGLAEGVGVGSGATGVERGCTPARNAGARTLNDASRNTTA